MKRTTLIAAVSLVVGVAVTAIPYAGAQRRHYFYGGQRTLSSQQFIRRINTLEQRVSALERLIGRRPAADDLQTSLTNVEDAEQRLAAATKHLAFSEELYRKGYISEAELEAERFALRRIEKLLRLAKAQRDGEPIEAIAAEIKIHDAEHNLAVAERNLRLAERVAARGFQNRDSIEAHRQAVAEARKGLDVLKSRKALPE